MIFKFLNDGTPLVGLFMQNDGVQARPLNDPRDFGFRRTILSMNYENLIGQLRARDRNSLTVSGNRGFLRELLF